MNRFCLFSAACVLILAASLAWSAEPITVKMKSLSYDPRELEIHVGDSVVWTNTAFTTHTATSDDEGKTFDTGEIKPEESSKPVKFEREGEFKYHCKIHGKSMSGTVIVKPAGGGK
jgi:plastocyanin